MGEKIPHVWNAFTTIDLREVINDEVYQALLAYWKEGYCTATVYQSGDLPQQEDGQIHIVCSLADPMDDLAKYVPLVDLLKELVEDYGDYIRPKLERLQDDIAQLLTSLDITAPKE